RVGALEANLLAVRRPPEPAAPAELLLRDELGDPVLDSFGMDRQPPGRPVRDEPQIAVAHERDGPTVGRQMRIVDGALRIDDTPGTGRAIDQIELATERNHDDASVVGDVDGDD